jgi:hypothetical protein
LLACTDLLAGDLIEAVAPIARRRLRDEIKARVLGPYRDSDHRWWLGLRKKDLNNWTPWIHSNLLLASLLLDIRREDIVSTAERAVAALDRYLDAVLDDGGCDEGIKYWWRAGGSLFECLETLASACGDDYGVFEIQKIRAIARYPVITHIADGWHVNFADGSPKPAATPHLLYRFGRRIGDQEVVRHARALRGDQAAANMLAGPTARSPGRSARCSTPGGRRRGRADSRCPFSRGSPLPACLPPGNGRARRAGSSWPPRPATTRKATTTPTSGPSSWPWTGARC